MKKVYSGISYKSWLFQEGMGGGHRTTEGAKFLVL